MGKKSSRNNKNNGGPLRKGLAQVVPTTTYNIADSTIYETVTRLMDARNYEEILRVESKYRHLDHTFSDDPVIDAYVLTAFGRANFMSSKRDDISWERGIHYYERAKERIDAHAGGHRQAHESIKPGIGKNLAVLYSKHPDTMEKAISSHRWWFLANCCRQQVTADYLINLSNNFNKYKKFEYTIEVLEGSMDIMETLKDEDQAVIHLIAAYIGCGEFLKAKTANKERRSNHWTTRLQSGRIEKGMCNYEAAIAHFRKAVDGLQKQGYDDSLNGTRVSCSVGLANNLLQHSADNEAEAFAIFQEELDRCVDPLCREEIIIQMGTEYRKFNKWDQSIDALHQLCLSSTRPPHGTMLPQANEAMAQTYLEQYCTDTTLDIDQRFYAMPLSIPTRLMSSRPKCTLPELSSSTSMVTNMMRIVISSYTWMLAWPNASSVVILASNGSDTDQSRSVARAAW